jgi:uncharacterized protein with NRDE domain
MCLILFANGIHPKYRLILAANRDEFYGRPAKPLAFWDDAPSVLAGRDLKSMGTWLGVNKAGLLAAITNFRAPAFILPDAPSRGGLVSKYLMQNGVPITYLENIQKIGGMYNGFNLLMGKVPDLYYYSNKAEGIKKIGPGLYGLSNDLLDTPWPKVIRGKNLLAGLLKTNQAIDPQAVFKILEDRAHAPDNELPDTGVGDVWERILSPIFINGKIYGTRCSSVILMENSGRTIFYERTFDRVAGEPVERETVTFVVKATQI